MNLVWMSCWGLVENLLISQMIFEKALRYNLLKEKKPTLNSCGGKGINSKDLMQLYLQGF
jgi:hypothetical protein